MQLVDRMRRIARHLVAPSAGKTHVGQQEAQAAIARVRKYTMVADEGLATLFQQVVHVDQQGIPGAVVECGVWHGGCVALAAIAHLTHGEGTRDLHLFDSFEGIPEPVAGLDGERAVADARGRFKASPGGQLAVAWDYAERGGPGTPDGAIDLLTGVGYDRDLIHIHKGWFQDTVPSVAPHIGHIALLHLDGDWYESTKVCLDHLYDQVVPGGFVIVDDYGAYEGCRQAVDEFLDRQQTRPFLSRVNGWIVYLVKP
jgi:O-methyltransferase